MRSRIHALVLVLLVMNLAVAWLFVRRPVARTSIRAHDLGCRVNVNQADAATLCLLPSVGPGLADKIIGYRREHGPFGSVEQLGQIKGVGDVTVARLRSFAVCGEPTATRPAQ